MSSKLLKSRILFKGPKDEYVENKRARQNIIELTRKYCREGHLFSSRIYKQSQAHDEIDRFIYTTKSVTKETLVDYVVFLDGCDQFEDKIHSLLHCSPLRDNI